MIKFIATDMDGTLVNDNGIINEKVFELIHNLKEKGIIFAAASGRFYSQLNRNFEKVDTDMILIAHNGAVIKYNKMGKTLYSNEISKEDIKHVVNLKRELGEELFLAGNDEAFIVKPSETILSQFSFHSVPTVILNDFDEVQKPIYKLTYYVANGVKQSMLDYLKANLGNNLEFVASGHNWIDIMNKGISKGNAIKILQERFDINRNNTMVFGDYYNDLTMFKAAHYSYAMENAPEDVKKHANFVAQNNNEDGVYNVIHKYASSL